MHDFQLSEMCQTRAFSEAPVDVYFASLHLWTRSHSPRARQDSLLQQLKILLNVTAVVF